VAVREPERYGVIVRKTAAIPAEVFTWLATFGRGELVPQEDEELWAAFVGMHDANLPEISTRLATWKLAEGRDYVYTRRSYGPLTPVGFADWLQQDVDEGYSHPCEGRQAHAPRPPVAQQVREYHRREHERRRIERIGAWLARRLERGRRRIVAEAAADRRWPGWREGRADALLGEAWQLMAFVEGSRTGGPARQWVEAAFPSKRWHIPVRDGYKDGLEQSLRAWYRAGDMAALRELVFHAGYYFAVLEGARGTQRVDVDCYAAWLSRGVPSPIGAGAV